MANCSKGGFRSRKTHDRRQQTAVYVGSQATKMSTTGGGDGSNQRRAGCGRKGTVDWSQTVQASVDEHGQLEVDAFGRPQPVKVS